MTGKQVLDAIFEDGVFKPLAHVPLPDHQRVSIVVTVPDDIPTDALASTALRGGALDFLSDHREDLYTADDGEPV